MKKTLFFALLSVAVGCTQNIDFEKPPDSAAKNPVTDVVSEVHSLDLGSALYDEVADSWIVPKADPYALKNFQNAYDNLVAGKSTLSLTRTMASEFSVSRQLRPTHYVLRIYPKNENEQWRVETMTDVKVAYIPFDHVRLTEQQAQKATRTLTRSAADTFAERSPYTVTFENYKSTSGGPTDPFTLRLPILYTVWPVAKPLPADLEYVLDYEIFLPPQGDAVQKTVSDASLSSDAMSVLCAEALSLARGRSTRSSFPFTLPISVPFSGYMLAYDGTVSRNVPMDGLKVRYQDGSNISDAVATSTGRYHVMALMTVDPFTVPSMDLTLTLTYQDPAGKWKITTGSSTVPHTLSATVHFVNDTFDQGVITFESSTVLSSGSYQANEIQRGAHYFFDHQTDFPKPSLSGGIQIIAYNTSNGNIHGAFQYSAPPLIHIWKNGTPPHGFAVGTTLHELGHFAHYGDNVAGYYYTPLFLKESFSLYSGWYLAHKYYQSLGKTIYPDQDLTEYALNPGQSAQAWDKDDSPYVPLLVDLTDNMNQRSYYGPYLPPATNYPNDNISGVPASVVWSIVSSNTTWDQYRAALQSYAGTGSGKYFTTAQFNEWITTFDEWLVDYSDYLTLLWPPQL